MAILGIQGVATGLAGFHECSIRVKPMCIITYSSAIVFYDGNSLPFILMHITYVYMYTHTHYD